MARKGKINEMKKLNEDKVKKIADQYRALAAAEPNVLFGGRLAEYKYYDMAPTIESAMKAANQILTHQ